METVGTYAVVPFISGLFNVLLERLAPENMRELLIGSDSTTAELSKLRTSMMIVKRAINDAEEKQDSDPDVKSWLKEVKHAVYDAEDLIDEIHTEVVQRRLESEAPSSQHHGSQVLSSITATFGRLVIALDPFHEGIDSKVRKMNHRFEGFSQLIKVLNLRFSVEQSWGMSPSRLTSSFVDESIIYGRDSEKELIVGLLQDGVRSADDHGSVIKGRKFLEGNIRTLAIIGMPGMGKTTLAQLVFNDPIVDQIFEFKSWICVPNVFDIIQIIKSLLNSLFEPNQYLADLERNQSVLRKAVSGRRILIVLDDVCDENLNAGWQYLLASLKSAAPGSTIIVTTRNEDIAKLFHPFYILPLHELSHEDCWAILKLHAFGYTDAAPDMKLEASGREILAKCGGLPLAVKVLGGFLRYSLDVKDWEIMASSKILDFPSCKKEILPALLLSYNYLPAHLKRCFSYCSIFPKKYHFDKEKLVLQWMAEGFIVKGRNDSRRMEDIGNIYFHDLLARHFFQLSSSKNHCFVMHDLIHDLAVYVMEEFSFMLEPNISHVSMGMLRHFSFIMSKYETMEKFGPTAYNDHLRTFLPVVSSISASSFLSNNLLHSLQLFGRLRLLSLCGYRITSLPSSIGSLKHLRYLDFSSTFIEELPESICDLFNLQTLLLSHCKQLRMLPTMMRNLLQLRHLNIQGTCIEEMPEHIGKLSSLQTLTDFVASETRGGVRELGELLQLRGSLKISGLENVFLEADAFAANLKDKVHLDEIILVQWEVCSVPDRPHERIIHAFKPHTNLRRLTIDYYEGDKFPGWLGDEAFCNLEVLHLKQCSNCVELPSLGNLPLLKHLLIKDFDQLETLGAEFYGQLTTSSSPFKSLLTLKFEGLQQFKKWCTYEGNGMPFPSLQELYVVDCRKLEGDFPLEFPSLVELNVRDCQKLCGSLPNAPCLRVLNLVEFGWVNLASLAHFICLTNLVLKWGNQVQNDSITNAREAIQHLTSLEKLEILTQGNGTINQQPWLVPTSVRAVSILSDEVIQINGFSQLQYLYVRNISSPLRFPTGHFQLINYLFLAFSDGLIEFPIILAGDELGFSSMIDLALLQCNQFTSFPAGGFPAPYLTTLCLHQCENLMSLPDRMSDNFPSLIYLGLRYCPQLESFPEDGLPLHLLTLSIHDCDKLLTLPRAMSHCASLELLDIDNCRELALFPESGLPPNLHKLRLCNCKNIRSLPDRIGITLKILDIWKCSKLESFPQSGLPPSLELLQIYGCEELVKKYADWKLGKLSCLKELIIGGSKEAESFPADGSLPTSLITVKIDQFYKLRSINCGELRRIGGLRELEFQRCPSLLFFSGDLPQSLCRLTIQQSPLMEQSCVGPDGYYVDKISHITCLELDA